MIHDFENGKRSLQILIIGHKRWSKNWRAGIKKLYKTLTMGPKRLKYGLKWSPEDTLGDPWFLQTFFFQNWGVEVVNF